MNVSQLQQRPGFVLIEKCFNYRHHFATFKKCKSIVKSEVWNEYTVFTIIIWTYRVESNPVKPEPSCTVILSPPYGECSLLRPFKLYSFWRGKNLSSDCAPKVKNISKYLPLLCTNSFRGKYLNYRKSCRKY